MNRKDYLLIANILKDIQIDHDFYPHQSLIEDFTDELKKDNPKFDEQWFKDVCNGIEVVSVHYDDIVMEVHNPAGITYFTLSRNGKLNIGVDSDRSGEVYSVLVNLGLRELE